MQSSMSTFTRSLRTVALTAIVVLAAGCHNNEATTVAPATTETSAPAESTRPASPNLLLIVADDLGYSDLSLYGSEIPTPNLDELARGGMLLEQFYSGLTCSPTRSMLLSGTDNHVAGLGVMGAPTRDDHKGLPGYVGYLNSQVVSVADILSEAGYNTYMAGKWHLGPDVENGPRARGFQRSFVSLDGAAHLGGWDWRGPMPADYRDGDELVHVGDDFYTTRDYTQKMIDYIDAGRSSGKPFFGYMAYTAPHWPLQAPDESIARFKGVYDAGYEATYAARYARMQELGMLPKNAQPIDNRRFTPRWDTLSTDEKAIEARRMEVYAAMVSDLDAYVGRLIAYLKQIGEFDNTFILFMSDNGAESSRRDLAPNIADHIGKEYDHSLGNLGRANSYVMYGPNWASVSETPFNRHKATAFEGGIHVPAFVHYPPLISPGSRSVAVSTVMDVLPTLLELAGTSHPGALYRGQPVAIPAGISMLPLLAAASQQIHGDDEVLGWELYGYRSVRQGDWKIVWDQAQPTSERRWQLFNIAEDPAEQRDLSESNPQRLADMIANWDLYAQRNGVVY